VRQLTSSPFFIPNPVPVEGRAVLAAKLVQVGLELTATDPVVSAHEPLLQVADGAIRQGTTDRAPRRNSVRSGCRRGKG
jgi:hypothetical protein